MFDRPTIFMYKVTLMRFIYKQYIGGFRNMSIDTLKHVKTGS